MHVKKTIDPKRYMDGRITVMGVAAILITWFHCDVIITPGSLLELFKLTGDIGVDMFLFASGAGIYLAANKYPSYFEYLYRRVRRVLIPYLCVYVPVYSYERVMLGGGYSRFLKRILLLDFWLEGDLGNWYIAGILLLYIITPSGSSYGKSTAGCMQVHSQLSWLDIFSCAMHRGLSIGIFSSAEFLCICWALRLENCCWKRESLRYLCC